MRGRPGEDGGWTGGQYSLLRAGTGALAALVLLRSCADGALWFEPGSFGLVGLGLGALCALLVSAGLADRALALPVALLAAIVSPLGWSALVLGAAHAVTPPAPYGSLAARGRVDPGNGWTRGLPGLQLAWLTLFLQLPAVLTCTGYAPLDLRLIEAVRLPLGLLGRGLELLEELGGTSDGLHAWLYGMAVIAPALILGWGCCYLPRARAALWGALALLFAGGLAHRGLAQSGLDSALVLPALLLAWTFEPRWVPARLAPGNAAELVFYDGACGLCHGFVRFVLAEDRHGAFGFAPLQSDAFTAAVPADERAELPDSIVVRTARGATLSRSSAVVHVGLGLGGSWRLAAYALLAIPRPLRDLGYDAVARVRHRLFRTPEAACPMLPPHLVERFRL